MTRESSKEISAETEKTAQQTESQLFRVICRDEVDKGKCDRFVDRLNEAKHNIDPNSQ